MPDNSVDIRRSKIVALTPVKAKLKEQVLVTVLLISQLPRFKERQLLEPSKNRPPRRFFRLQSKRLRREGNDLKKNNRNRMKFIS